MLKAKRDELRIGLLQLGLRLLENRLKALDVGLQRVLALALRRGSRLLRRQRSLRLLQGLSQLARLGLELLCAGLRGGVCLCHDRKLFPGLAQGLRIRGGGGRPRRCLLLRRGLHLPHLALGRLLCFLGGVEVLDHFTLGRLQFVNARLARLKLHLGLRLCRRALLHLGAHFCAGCLQRSELRLELGHALLQLGGTLAGVRLLLAGARLLLLGRLAQLRLQRRHLGRGRIALLHSLAQIALQPLEQRGARHEALLQLLALRDVLLQSRLQLAALRG